MSVLEGNVDPRGAWAASTEYGYGDIVEESGASYVSINVSNQGHKPGRSPTSWLAVGGSTGEKVREEEGTPCGRSPHQV